MTRIFKRGLTRIKKTNVILSSNIMSVQKNIQLKKLKSARIRVAKHQRNPRSIWIFSIMFQVPKIYKLSTT